MSSKENSRRSNAADVIVNILSEEGSQTSNGTTQDDSINGGVCLILYHYYISALFYRRDCGTREVS